MQGLRSPICWFGEFRWIPSIRCLFAHRAMARQLQISTGDGQGRLGLVSTAGVGVGWGGGAQSPSSASTVAPCAEALLSHCKVRHQ